MGKKVKKEAEPPPQDVFDPLSVESKKAATVVLMLQSPEEEVLAKACEALYKFAEKGDENKGALLGFGAVASLAKLISHEEKTVRRNATMAFGVMAAHSDVRKQMRKLDVIPSVIARLAPEEDVVIHEFASLCLAYMSVEYANKVKIFEQDGLEPLIQLLSSPDPDVKKNSVECIYNLVQDFQSRAAVRELNGIPPLLGLLKSEYSIIQQLALKTLITITNDTEARVAFRENQGPGQMIALLEIKRIVIFGGDFNCILSPGDRASSPSRLNYDEVFLGKVIMQALLKDGFRDKNLRDPGYTFIKGGTRSRIDRMYISQSVKVESAVVCPNIFSDHAGVMLRVPLPKSPTFGGGIWRFNSSLLSRVETGGYVNQVLEDAISLQCMFETSGAWWEFFKKEMAGALQQLGSWVKKRSQEEHARAYRTLVGLFDECQKGKAHSAREFLLEKKKLSQIVKDKEVSLQFLQKLDSNKGGHNIQYEIFTKRRQNKELDSVVIDSEEKKGKELLEAVGGYFAKLFRSKSSWDKADMEKFLNTCSPKKHLGSEQMGCLEPICREEISTIISQLANGKSPGPDGLTGEFYKSFKDKLVPHLMIVYNDILSTGILPNSLMEALLLLLYKKGDKQDLKNYRLIMMLNVDYKILVKILQNRLQKLVYDFLNPVQKCSITGKSMAHSLGLLREAVTAAQYDGANFWLVSLDQEKAFDKVFRPFLFASLLHLGQPKTIRPQPLYLRAEIRKLLHEQEVEKTLITLLAVDNDGVKTAASQAVAVMCENLASKDVLRKQGIPLLVQLLNSANEEVKEAAALALANLTNASPINACAVFEAEGVEPLINLLTAKRDGAIANAATVLTNMATQEAVRSSIQSHGIMHVIVEPLRSSNSVVLSKIALTVASVACDAGARSEFMNAGGLELLVKLLLSNNEDVRRNACWAVFVCASDEPTATELCRLSALDILQEINMSVSRKNYFSKATLIKLLDNNLSYKYSFLGYLSASDITSDGFYDLGQVTKLYVHLNIMFTFIIYNSKPKTKMKKEEEKLKEEEDVQLQNQAKQQEILNEKKPWFPPFDSGFQSYILEVTKNILPMRNIKEQVVTLANSPRSSFLQALLGAAKDTTLRFPVSGEGHRSRTLKCKTNLSQDITSPLQTKYPHIDPEVLSIPVDIEEMNSPIMQVISEDEGELPSDEDVETEDSNRMFNKGELSLLICKVCTSLAPNTQDDSKKLSITLSITMISQIIQVTHHTSL
nr:PREDICTED: uncharacterized protein LOC102357489 [Latimeria chalumnae]|eukprot:XP_014353509.1 PREDICTED: uncharacterized protein LOC102357489 [Latimeria chalumnae]